MLQIDWLHADRKIEPIEHDNDAPVPLRARHGAFRACGDPLFGYGDVRVLRRGGVWVIRVDFQNAADEDDFALRFEGLVGRHKMNK